MDNCIRNEKNREFVVSLGAKFIIVCVLVAIIWGLGRIESAVDLRERSHRYDMVDVGFMATQSLHNYLRQHPFVHDMFALWNTLFVGGCLLYGVFYQAFYKGRPGVVVCGIMIYALRLFLGWMTQLPVHTEYMYSKYDFPDIIHGENVNFFFFFSGHTAIAAILASHVQRWGYPKTVWFLHIGNVIQAVRMLATRGHFASDLVVGILVGIEGSKYADVFDQLLPRLGIATYVSDPAFTVGSNGHALNGNSRAHSHSSSSSSSSSPSFPVSPKAIAKEDVVDTGAKAASARTRRRVN